MIVSPSVRQSNSNDSIVNSINRMPLLYLNAVKDAHNNSRFLLADINGFDNNIAKATSGFPSTWIGLRLAMRAMLADSMTGIQFSGSEVCGSATENIDEELCVRW